MRRLYILVVIAVVLLVLSTFMGKVSVSIGWLIGTGMIMVFGALVTGFMLCMVAGLVAGVTCLVIGFFTPANEAVPEDAGVVFGTLAMGVAAARLNLELGLTEPWFVWFGSVVGAAISIVVVLYMASSILTESGTEKPMGRIFVLLSVVAVISYFTAASWVVV